MARSSARDIPRHPISVVTGRTGLSAHVLRAWERRYRVVHPARSRTGTRLYSDADVQRLSLLRSATRVGRAVASVAGLTTVALRRMVAEDAERASRRPTLPRSYHAAMMDAVRDLAPDRLEQLLRRALLSLGAVTFLEEVVAPVLAGIGEEWHEGRITIVQEHAASAALLQLLGVLVRELEVPGAAPRIVIATPRGERHAFGALMAAAAASHDGWHVTWLGVDLPAAQIAAGARQGSPRAVALSAVAHSSSLAKELRALRLLLPAHVPLLVGGGGAARLAEVEGVTPVRDLAHWRALLRNCTAA
jgi:methanogenic corrinoid protein MtbC1